MRQLSYIFEKERGTIEKIRPHLEGGFITFNVCSSYAN
jgi:hypothetical protein